MGFEDLTAGNIYVAQHGQLFKKGMLMFIHIYYIQLWHTQLKGTYKTYLSYIIL